MATLLNCFIEWTEQMDVSTGTDKMFQCRSRPTISFKDYIFCIIKKLKFSDAVLLSALIYVFRYFSVKKEFGLCVEMHRLFTTALFIAEKYQEDDWLGVHVLCSYFAYSPKELLRQESIFINTIKFTLGVSEYDVNTLCKILRVDRELLQLRKQPFGNPTIMFHNLPYRLLKDDLISVGSNESLLAVEEELPQRF